MEAHQRLVSDLETIDIHTQNNTEEALEAKTPPCAGILHIGTSSLFFIPPPPKVEPQCRWRAESITVGERSERTDGENNDHGQRTKKVSAKEFRGKNH